MTRLRTAGLLIILVALLTVLFVKAATSRSAEHDAFEADLRLLRELDAGVNLGVLSSRFGLQADYDDLTRGTVSLREVARRMQAPPNFLDADGRARLQGLAVEYLERVERKAGLVERFKAENAVLRNSLAYFPVAAAALADRAQGPAGALALGHRLEDLLQTTLLFVQTEDDFLAERILGLIRDIDAGRNGYPAGLRGEELSIVLLHARTLLRVKPAVDGLTRGLLALPTQQAHEDLVRAYRALYGDSLMEANRYRVVLYLVAVVLAGYIVMAVIRLRTASLQLARSNAALQERIAERRRAEEALRESEERYRLLFNCANDAVFVHGLKDGVTGTFIEVNDVACRRLGYTREELLQMTPADVDDPAHRRAIPAVAGRLERQKDLVFESVHLAKDGREIPVEISAHMFDYKGQPTVMSLVRDITQRKRDEESLRLLAKVFESSSEGIVITDAAGIIVAVNRAFSDITGFSADEARGRTPAILRSERQDRGFYQNMWAAIRGAGQWRGEIWNRRKDGRTYPEWLSISALRNPAGEITHYVGIFADISERKQIEERIEFLAHHDALTGLPNRVLLQDRLFQAIAHARRSRGERVAVMFVDLDRFKLINDTLGHDSGDSVLQLIAERIAGVVRHVDTVSRQGGDEFVVILPQLAHPEDAGHVAAKIIDGLAAPFELNGHELSVTSSIGISVFPEDGETPQVLMRNADTAMYRAKSEGRNAFRYYRAEMNAASLESLVMESRLRHAIERRELVLYYQPQVDMASGRITGLEALLRWETGDMGMVMPTRFIPMAEETGLILPIGEWVLQAACAQAVAWREAGRPPLSIAVNLSPRQFDRQDLLAVVTRALEASGLPPHALELELTESMLMRDCAQSVATLQELKLMGVRLAVDDFGTGYSSLSYLKQFPLDRLKIDRSFVSGVVREAEDGTIAAAIIGLAHTLGLEVVAEGVETRQQFDMLAALRCDTVQGFLLGRPLPAEQVEAQLREGMPAPSTA